MQAVILAGGLGTRLRPLTNGVPKAMVMVHGKPFLEYQVRLLLNGGITSLVLCIGHLGQRIRRGRRRLRRYLQVRRATGRAGRLRLIQRRWSQLNHG
jgi:NDP-sugar pyrophosphorylase family protein